MNATNITRPNRMRHARSVLCALGLILLLQACRLPEPFPASPLELDFTFPAGELLPGLEALKGLAINPDDNTAYVLTKESELLHLSLEGELLGRLTLATQSKLTGVTWLPDGGLAIVARNGQTFRFDWEQQTLSTGPAFGRNNRIQGIAAGTNGDLYAISNTKAELLHLSATGEVDQVRLALNFWRYRVTGLTTAADHLFATVQDKYQRDAEPLLIQLRFDGEFVQAWQLGGNPSGVVILNTASTGPTLLTTNTDKTILQWEPAPTPGEVDIPPLEYIGQYELGEDVGQQPSGIDFNEIDERLYYITDFGKVVSTAQDGSEAQVLFEIDDARQGIYEAIAVDNSGNLYLVGSDAQQDSIVVQYQPNGVLLSERNLPDLGPDQLVQGYTLDPASGSQWWVTSSPGLAKRLYEQTNAGQLNQWLLPDEYDEFGIVGLELSNNVVYLLTNERQTDTTTLAGLLLLWDINNSMEVARYSVAVPDAEGSLIGVIAPSGVAINPASELVYITADNDNGDVYVFDLD